MTGIVRRQLVGGPADGRRVDVEAHTSVYLVPGRPTAVRLTSSGFTMSDLADRKTIQYQAATAPTGERVFLAPGAVYPERFDTPEWVGLRAPALRDLVHVAPWLWRGRAAWPTGDPERLQYVRHWTYIGISACGRYEVRQQVTGTDRLGMLGSMVDPDEYCTRDMRYRLAYTQLPTCPEFDCDEKAVATVTVTGGGDSVWLYGERIGYRQRFAMCREHTRTMTMLTHWLRPGPDVIDLEGNPYVDPEDDPYHSMHAARSRALYRYGAINPPPADLFRNINIY